MIPQKMYFFLFKANGNKNFNQSAKIMDETEFL